MLRKQKSPNNDIHPPRATCWYQSACKLEKEGQKRIDCSVAWISAPRVKVSSTRLTPCFVTAYPAVAIALLDIILQVPKWSEAAESSERKAPIARFFNCYATKAKRVTFVSTTTTHHEKLLQVNDVHSFIGSFRIVSLSASCDADVHKMKHFFRHSERLSINVAIT